MAKKDSKDFMANIKTTDLSKTETKRFDEGLERNTKDYHLKESQWTYARNAINNSNIGDVGKLGNEPANLLCITVPNGYAIIGWIHIEADKYAIYSTNNINSEIGYFEEDSCSYTKIVNDDCLNFKTTNLIYGVARETSECNHVLYWDDGLNASRVLNIGDIRTAPYPAPWPNVPWKCVDTLPGPCIDCEPVGPPYILDCDKIRLAPLMDPLCLRVEKGTVGGNLLNGSYFVVGAYTVKGERMTDYFPPSNQQPIFNHIGTGGSITIYVDNADTSYFDEFELVVISVIQQQTVAKKVGIYSTRTQQINLDIIDQSLVNVPIEYIPVRSQVYDKSDAMYTANDYLMRVGPTTKLDFNYQPLANQIVTKWQSVEYDADYYIKGGNKTGYMRDEVYSFFIRFVYDTGDRSASYHIPGRPSFNTPVQNPGLGNFLETAVAPSNLDHYETYDNNYSCPAFVWQVYNTATATNAQVIPPIYIDEDTSDCPNTGPGRVLQEGYMGYWESTESYPDNKPEIWNSNVTVAPYSSTSPSQYDLCGKPIRHHRFPDNDFSLNSTIFDTRAGFLNTPQKIRIMGVKFENILPPRIDPHDPNSPIVPGVKCFEILRGSRKGNRTVIAKGIINNMVQYDIPDEVSNKIGLFQNYPYNDIRGDEFLSTNRTRWRGFSGTYGYFSQSTGNPLNGGSNPAGSNAYDVFMDEEGTIRRYRQEYFSFHSPETNFSNPFLGTRELKVYQELDGRANMRYQQVGGHPKHKMMTDLAWLLAAMAGLGVAAFAVQGKIVREYPLGTIDRTAWEQFGLNVLSGYLGFGVESLNSFNPIPGWPIQGLPNGLYLENTAATSVSPVFSWLFQAFAGAAPTFSYYWMEGADATYAIITKAVAYQQYALQQMSHCFYDNSVGARYVQALGGLNARAIAQRRRYINEISYVDNQIQDFDNNKRINNLYRSRFVAIKTSRTLTYPFVGDYTRKDTSFDHLSQTSGPNRNPPLQPPGWPNPGTPGGAASPPNGDASQKTYLYKNPQTPFQRESSTYYAAIKQRLKNQYGQLNNISQIPITTCPNCCINEGGPKQLVVNPYFSSGISGWTTNNWTLSTQGNPAPGAQTFGSNIANQLSQPIAWVPGETYQFCFEIRQLDSVFSIGVSFVSSSPNSYAYTYNTAGNYCLTVTALAGWDSINFVQYATGSTCTTWPVAQTCFTPISIATSTTNTNTLRSNSTYGWLSGQIGEFIDLRLALPSTGTNNLSNNITLYPGGSGEKGSVQNRRTRGILGGCTNVAQSPAQLTYNDITSGYFEGNGTYCVSIDWSVDITQASTVCDFQDCSPFENNIFMVYLAVFKPGGVTPYSGAINNPYGGFARFTGTSMDAGGMGCATNIPLNPVQTNNNPGFANYGNVTYYQVYLPGSVGLGAYAGTCNIQNLVLQPGWKAIPYVYMHGVNAGFTFCVKPILNKATVLDNVTITRDGCDGSQIGPLFGGDIYINRYTEKNTFFYFYEWLFKQPDGSYFDYTKYNMLPYPTYWINTDPFDIGDGVLSLTRLINPVNVLLGTVQPILDGVVDIGNIIGNALDQIPGWPIPYTGPANPTFAPSTSYFEELINGIKSPSDYHVLDRPNLGTWAWQDAIDGGLGQSLLQIGSTLLNPFGGYDIGFVVKYGYFYLFNSGVRDFYVESEYNVALRDWDDETSRRHYDYKTFTSLSDMFYTDIIKSGNYYKYDPSLSIAKNWYSYVNWGNMQQRNYDPVLADTCFEYRPDRVIYSLQQQYESVKDNWRLFLANNYKDFLSRVNSIKQVNKSGVLILFQSDSPLMFQGLDQLQTDLGTKLTIGDGGLFSQPMQSVSNAERAFEYASCQNRLSVVNTPFGTFWINQNQGKIFQMSSSITEVSMSSVKWWLAKYLPYNLTRYFPDYPHTDNPVMGIGCQTIYDNQNNLVYFTKKDYKPRLGLDGKPLVEYDKTNDIFHLPGFSQTVVQLGDRRYFENASWTLSFDVKSKDWISYHDWHPDLVITSKNTFMTTKDNGVWIHNKRCDLFTNYYNSNYPFEIEYTVDTVMNVNVLRSIEYQLEVYKYNQENCYDRFHVLDFNFDSAVIYNTEQCSGTLKLNLSPKNNAPAIIGYPFYNPTTVANEILYSKEENKYRFNQFYDITRDRGEFDFVLYPNTNPATGPIDADASSVSPINPSGAVPGGQQAGSYAVQPIWSTGADGYIKVLNTANLNYLKSPLQKKKFRHYTSSVLLRRNISGDKKMLVSIANNKNLLSPR